MAKVITETLITSGKWIPAFAEMTIVYRCCASR